MPILHQLVTLSIYQAPNAPMRLILQARLPGLQSLEIRAWASTFTNNQYEGEFPYEVDRLNANKVFLDNYMNSIARKVPNLKELSLYGYGVKPWVVSHPAYHNFAKDLMCWDSLL